MTAENLPGRGFNQDCADCISIEEKPGLKVLAVYKGSDIYVASRAGFFRRIARPVGVEKTSIPAAKANS